MRSARRRARSVGANALRAAVLGANDGIVSSLGIVTGIMGAGAPQAEVLVAGFAGLLAGALSMGMGEWLSVQSARELFAKEIATITTELATNPEATTTRLANLYIAKGVGPREARNVSLALAGAGKRALLDTLAREEYGVDPNELGGSAWVAAATSFAMFASGGLLPLLPLLLLPGASAVLASALLSAVALFAAGLAVARITRLTPLRIGVRTMTIGLAAAAITFGIGRLVGVNLR